MNGSNLRAAPDPRLTEDRVEGGKRNPLVDLIDSERLYLEQLGLVIRVGVSPNQRLRYHPSLIHTEQLFRDTKRMLIEVLASG